MDDLITSYQLRTERTAKANMWKQLSHTLRGMSAYLKGEGKKMIWVTVCLIIGTSATVLTPYMVARSIDTYIANRDLTGLMWLLLGMCVLYVVSSITSYLQFQIMGRISQTVLFRLRNDLFQHIQALPIAFFNQNKAGDLISRINFDTDKVNQFLSGFFIRFTSIFVSLIGITVFIIVLNVRMALVLMLSTVILVVGSRALSGWVQRTSKRTLEADGALSGEVQENLNNFKALVAFNRQDYFVDRVNQAATESRKRLALSDIASGIFAPIYNFAGNLAQVMVLVYGVYLIQQGHFTAGLLIGFLAYTQKFYEPLRILGSIWGNLQSTLAAWTRISEILNLKSNLNVIEVNPLSETSLAVLSFQNVSFGYGPEHPVMKEANFDLEKGKTYALIGPTGGGKSTTASLMARLYDPTEGIVNFMGRDIRSFRPEELATRIGFILQDPFLFSGTVGDNIRYGNAELESASDEEIVRRLEEAKVSDLLDSFPEGLRTDVDNARDNISLGQKQLIAFARMLLRKPDLLILDEATANIDTVTEQKLNHMIEQLPAETTKVVIAHRLNTIKNADQIFFVNEQTIHSVGSFEHALELIDRTKRAS